MRLLSQTSPFMFWILFYALPAVATPGQTTPLTTNIQDATSPVKVDLTIETAIKLALERHPILQAQAAAVRAEEAKFHRASARDNPTVELSGENFAGSGEYRGMQGLEATLSLSQSFAIGNDRERRQQRAEAQKQITMISGEIIKHDLIAAVKDAFVNTLEAQALLGVEHEGLALSERLASVVARHAHAGGGSPVDISNAAIDLAKAQLRVASAEDALHNAKVKLAAFWGETSVSFDSAIGSLAIAEPLPDIDTQGIEQSLAASQGRAEHQAGLAAIADAEAQAQPDLTLSGGIRYFQEGRRVGAVLGASIPVPIFDHSSIEEARQRASESLARSQATKLQLMSDLILVRSRFQSATRELRVLDATLLPKASEGQRILEKSYSLGGSSYFELAASNRSLIELKSRRIAVICETQRQRYYYERLLGATDSSL